MLEFLFLILFYQTTLALSYNNPCTNKCNFPGMICINSVCKCDLKNRFFWTGARCSQCPNDWTMTETACIISYATKMSWQGAEAACHNVKADLISFRDKSIIPLIYNASIKNSSNEVITRGAWTSARAINVSGLGIYKWIDKNIPPFDSKSDWWCKKTTANLGYPYPYDEPTKLLSSTNEVESCISYWRSPPKNQVICLDDQHCNRNYSFICEKSESSESKYVGPPPTDQSSGSVNNATIINNIVSTAAPRKKKSNTIIIIIAIIGVLILLALLSGVFCFLKFRNSTRSSQKSLIIDSNTKEESIPSDINTNDDDLNLNNPPSPVKRDLHMNLTKQEENNRGGYSKQQFDEFE